MDSVARILILLNRFNVKIIEMCILWIFSVRLFKILLRENNWFHIVHLTWFHVMHILLRLGGFHFPPKTKTDPFLLHFWQSAFKLESSNRRNFVSVLHLQRAEWVNKKSSISEKFCCFPAFDCRREELSCIIRMHD